MNAISNSLPLQLIRTIKEKLHNVFDNAILSNKILTFLQQEYINISSKVLSLYTLVHIGTPSFLSDDGFGVKGRVFYSVRPPDVDLACGNVRVMEEWGVRKWELKEKWRIGERDCHVCMNDFEVGKKGVKARITRKGHVEQVERDGVVGRIGIMGWIIGRIHVDLRGELWIVDIRQVEEGKRGRVRLVVAPGLPPEFRNQIVLFKVWNFIGAFEDGVLEVYLEDLISITKCDKMRLSVEENEYMSLGLFMEKDISSCKRDFQLKGFVRSKSAVLATKSCRPNFLLELCDSLADCSKESMTLVVFDGGAVRWWPFLQVGKRYGFGALGFATLPSLRGLKTVRAGTKAWVVTITVSLHHNFVDCNNRDSRENVQKPLERATVRRARYFESTKHMYTNSLGPGKVTKISRNLRSVQKSSKERSRTRGQLITYSGKISEVLTDGRLKLDDILLVYLGAFGGWCGGAHVTGVCMRPGACIRLTNVSRAYRCSKVRALMPTVRTSVEIVSFGGPCGIGDMENDRMKWRTSAWRLHWKELSPSEILWAEELFESLAKKFGSWLRQAQSPQKSSIICSGADPITGIFLGTKSSEGFIRRLMDLEGITGRTSNFGGKYVYETFISSNAGVHHQSCGGYFPYVPAIDEVSKTADSIWIKHCGTSVTDLENETSRASSENVPNPTWNFTLCSYNEFRSAIFARSGHDPRQSHVLLIGLLEPTKDADGFRLSDCSGGLSLSVLGKCAPEYMHAFVKISEFSILIECNNKLGGLKKSIIAADSSFSTLVGGPYSRVYSPLVHEPLSYLSVNTQEYNAVFSQLTKMTQTVNENSPLICFFVLRPSPPLPTEMPEFIVDGFLVAVRRGGYDNFWMSIFKRRSSKYGAYEVSDNGPFYSCNIIISGKEAIALRPLLHAGCLYAITCNALDKIVDFHEYFREVAGSSGNITLKINGPLWFQEIYENSMTFAHTICSDYSDNKENIEYQCSRNKSLKKDSRMTDVDSRGHSSRSNRWVEHLVVDSVSKARKALLSKKSMGAVIQQQESYVSFTALIVSRRPLTRVHRSPFLYDCFGDTDCDWLLEACDPGYFIRVFKIFCKGNITLPSAILPGATVSIFGAIVRRSHAGKAYFELGPCSVLIAISLSGESFSSHPSSFLCCQRPLVGLNRLRALSKRRGLNQIDNDSTVAMVYLTILRVLKIQLERKESTTCQCCKYCGAASRPWYFIDPYVECQVDDGTTCGWMLSCSFRVAMETLSATTEQVNKIKRYIFENGSISLQRTDLEMEDALKGNAAQPPYNEETLRMFQNLASRARRPVTALVAPRVLLSDTDRDTFGTTAVFLGRGRRMCTAVSNDRMRRFQCYAIVEDMEAAGEREICPANVQVISTREATEELLKLEGAWFGDEH